MATMTNSHNHMSQKLPNRDAVSYGEAIRSKSVRVTKHRLLIMTALSHERLPISIRDLTKKVRSCNESTLYRSLESLVDAQLVRRVHLDGAAARYELSIDRPHHHHIQCVRCGLIQDVDICVRSKEEAVLRSTPAFASVVDHSLEFFGICKPCASR